MKVQTFVIEKHMTHYPTITAAGTSVAAALKVMQEGNFRHLPVLEGNRIVGIVSQRDLVLLQSVMDKRENSPVSSVMSADPYIVRVGTPLAEVAKKMADNKYGSAIVVNEQTGIIGIFTTIDAMRLLSSVLSGKDEDQEWEGAAIEQYFSWSRDSECLD